MTTIADVFVGVHADVDGLGGEIEQGATPEVRKAGTTLAQRMSQTFKNPTLWNAVGTATGAVVGTAVGRGVGSILNGSAADNLGRFSTNVSSLGGALSVVGVSAGALGTVAVAADGLSGASDLLAMSTGSLTAVKGFFIATTNAETGAVTASGFAHLRARVATLAHRAATIAQTTATKIAAGAQWLLNAALTANPIGLVVAGIALLVGGFVLAYKKSETFRNMVNSLWGWLKKFVGFTPLGMLIKNFERVKDLIGTVIEKIKKLAGKLKDLPGVDSLGKVAGLVGKLPGFAAGGVLGPGLSIVGERGPEIIASRRGGERVYSNSDSRRMLGGGGFHIGQIIVTSGPREDASSSVPRALRNFAFAAGMA